MLITITKSRKARCLFDILGTSIPVGQLTRNYLIFGSSYMNNTKMGQIKSIHDKKINLEMAHPLYSNTVCSSLPQLLAFCIENFHLEIDTAQVSISRI